MNDVIFISDGQAAAPVIQIVNHGNMYLGDHNEISISISNQIDILDRDIKAMRKQLNHPLTQNEQDFLHKYYGQFSNFML